jgi:capsid protein
MFLVGWAVTYPKSTLEWIIALRRQFHQTVVQRYGNHAVQELAAQLKAEARRMNIPEAIAEEVIEENKEEIIERLGNRFAQELLDD